MSEHIDHYSRPLTYNTQTLPSLPSINDLAFGLRRCSACPKLLGERDSCADHERHSSNALQLADYQLAQDPFMKKPSMQRQRHSFYSPVLPAESTSGDSEPMYTPNVSRATSPVALGHAANSATQQCRRSSKQVSRRDSRRESLQRDNVSEQSKKIKKMEKEKACRRQQANCLSRTEDFYRLYCNWERREQSGGNGNGAGLHANKINISRASEVVSQHFIHKDRCAALRSGPEAVAKFERNMQILLNSASEETPFAHTFLFGTEEPCSHRDSKSKECTTHGTADWRECRALRSQARFDEQQARWMQDNILPDQQQEGWRRANL